MASALHPAAARSYSEAHTTSAAHFLRTVMGRIKSGATPNGKAHEGPSDTRVNSTDGNSETFLAPLQDAIGSFIMRMTYGRFAVEDGHILAMANRMANFLTTRLSNHYWVNVFPVCEYLTYSEIMSKI